jgi:hypothetical protein
VQAKRPDPTKKSYALRGRPQAAFSWRWNSNSKAVGDTTALPCPHRAGGHHGNVRCRTNRSSCPTVGKHTLSLACGPGRWEEARGHLLVAEESHRKEKGHQFGGLSLLEKKQPRPLLQRRGSIIQQQDRNRHIDPGQIRCDCAATCRGHGGLKVHALREGYRLLC